MKVQVESISPVKKKLSISIPEADVQAEFDEAYRKVGKQARIPGFRPGKVPRNLLEKRFGPSVESDVLETLVRRTIVAALEEQKLEAVAVPEILEPKRDQGNGFSYIASVEIKPVFEPKNYKGLKLTQPKIEIKQEQKDAVMKRLQDNQAVLKERDGAKTPVKGDFVALWIQSVDESGNVKSKEEPKEQVYEIGGEILLADIEKAVKKLPLNEATVVMVEAGKPKKEMHFRVTLKAIKEKILPSLDDEFAKSVGPFENLAALKKRIDEDLLKEAEENAKAELVKNLLGAIVEKNPIDLPDSMVHAELHGMMHGLWQQFQQAGVKDIPEEYSEEKLHKQMEPEARRRVQEQLILESISQNEGIALDPKELNERIAQMAQTAKVPTGEFRAYMEKTGRLGSLEFQLLARKTVDFLLAASSIE